MARERRSSRRLSVLVALVLPLGALAQERLGSEFQVNTYTTLGDQGLPSVAADTDGDFVVAWRDAGSSAVYALRFSSAGAALASEFEVSRFTLGGFLCCPSVGADAGGNFIVAWQRTNFLGDSDIFARRFSSVGAALASEFLVNTYTTSIQNVPSMVVENDGDFVVAWESWGQDGPSPNNAVGIFARRFSSAGAPLASEFQVNSHTPYGQRFPSAAADAGGNFIVAWESTGQDGSDAGVFARRFSSAGTPLASEFQVNSRTSDQQVFPWVAAAAGGNFIVAWASYGQDGSYSGVFARRFSSAGTPLASEFQVNTYTTDRQMYPAVAVDGDGDFVVSWASSSSPASFTGASPGQDGSSSGVFARRFSSAGAPLASEFQVNTYTTGSQRFQSLATGANDDFVVTWQSQLQDGSSDGVFGQRFGGLPDLDSDGVPDAVEDGGPNGGDGNADATADSEQANVASLPNVVDGQYLTLASPPGTTLVDVQSIDPASPPLPAGAGVLPFGVLSFKVVGVTPGGSVDVELSLPGGTAISSYFKFGSELGMPADHWYEFLHDGTTGAVLGMDLVTLTLVDGDRGDDDLTADGVIVEPGGPVAVGNLDIDGDGETLPLTDGLLALRFLFGFTGTALTSGAVGGDCTRCDAAAITPYLTGLGLVLDVDGDGDPLPLTDGLLALRFLFGFTGTTLTSGAVGGDCTRCDAAAIAPYLAGLTN